ncbi:MAG: hypothetical protein ACJ0F6_01385 [Acidimicrobiales bacterium]
MGGWLAANQPTNLSTQKKWDQPVTWEAIPNWEEPEGYGRDPPVNAGTSLLQFTPVT